MVIYMELFLFAIGIFIMNGTSSIKRLCNDKACYNLLKSNNRARVLHNIQLLIAKQLIKGLCYSEIGMSLYVFGMVWP